MAPISMKTLAYIPPQILTQALETCLRDVTQRSFRLDIVNLFIGMTIGLLLIPIYDLAMSSTRAQPSLSGRITSPLPAYSDNSEKPVWGVLGPEWVDEDQNQAEDFEEQGDETRIVMKGGPKKQTKKRGRN